MPNTVRWVYGLLSGMIIRNFAKFSFIKGTLTQIWKSANIFVLIWKWNIEDDTFKHFLLFEICTCEMCEQFVWKHSETIEYVKN